MTKDNHCEKEECMWVQILSYLIPITAQED